VFSFIETRLFTRLILEYLNDDDYGQLQALLIEQPAAGDVIRGSGGVRKLRWRAPGRGKRGGYRHLLLKVSGRHDLDVNDIREEHCR
jgi:hypothetical protein